MYTYIMSRTRSHQARRIYQAHVQNCRMLRIEKQQQHCCMSRCLTGTPDGSQAVVGVAKRTAREKVVKDPRLLDLFMAASAPAASTFPQDLQPQSPRAPGGVAVLAADRRPLLSGAHAADIVWACGLLRWLPSDGSRLEKLLELVARTAESPSGIDGWHITNAVWTLDRLDWLKSEADRGVFCHGSGAIDGLRERVASLPFRAISSLFEGLRVEDFTKEVAFGRDEIQLGGGKVRQTARFNAFPP